MLTVWLSELMIGSPSTYTVCRPSSPAASRAVRRFLAAKIASPPKQLRMSRGTIWSCDAFLSCRRSLTTCLRSFSEIAPTSSRSALTSRGADVLCLDACFTFILR